MNTSPAHREPAPRLLLWAALLGGVALAKVFAGFDPFPGWGGDPVISGTVIVTYTPVWMLAFDLLLVVASLGVVFTSGHAPRGAGIVWGIVLTASLVAVGHARLGTSFQLEGLIAGSSWASSLVAAAAGWHASCFNPRARRLLVAILMGAMAPLAMKAVLQLQVEHPDTVAAYLAHKAEFLDAQGWLADSPMALAYERRLMQAEPSGWFGLANVFATHMLTMSLVFFGLLITAWRHKVAPAGVFGLFLLFLAPALCVVLTGSKGGIGTLLVGLALFILVPRLHRFALPLSNRLAMGLGLACVALPLAGVVSRGLLGERFAELSLLFRWFYMQGATRIFADHWLTGVGPAGFRDAYVRVKNPLAAEDPVSPHSILFDWGAGLGLAGLVLGVLLIYACMKAARSAVHPDPDSPQDADDYWELRLGMLSIIGAVIAGLIVERAMVTPESAITRLIGTVGSLMFVITLLRFQRHFPRHMSVGIAIALLACVMHLQIEMSATTIGAATWILLFIGVGVSRTPTVVVRTRRVIAAGILVVGGLLAWQTPRVVAWERSLREAHAVVAPIPDLGEQLTRVIPSPPNAIARQDLAQVLGGLLGRAVAADNASLQQALGVYVEGALGVAAQHLARAHDRVPSHLPTAQALARVRFHLAQRLEARGGTGALAAALNDAEQLGTRILSIPGAQGAQVHAWMAQVLEKRAELGDGVQRAAVVEHLTQAVDCSPFDPILASRLARAHAAAGDPSAAASWARRALELHANRRLDPLSGLPDREQEAMWKLVDGAQGPG